MWHINCVLNECSMYERWTVAGEKNILIKFVFGNKNFGQFWAFGNFGWTRYLLDVIFLDWYTLWAPKTDSIKFFIIVCQLTFTSCRVCIWIDCCFSSRSIWFCVFDQIQRCLFAIYLDIFTHILPSIQYDLIRFWYQFINVVVQWLISWLTIGFLLYIFFILEAQTDDFAIV